jgi:hypothetical protein
MLDLCSRISDNSLVKSTDLTPTKEQAMKQYVIVDTHPDTPGVELTSRFGEGSKLWELAHKCVWTEAQTRALEVGAEYEGNRPTTATAIRRIA